MVFFWLFLLFAAGTAALLRLLGFAVWLSALGFLLAFLLAHVLFVVVNWLSARRTDLSRDGEKINPLVSASARHAGRILCFYGGARPTVRGEEKLPRDSRFLFVCNHRSMFDPLIVMGWLDRWNIAFVSKPSNLRIPMIGTAVKSIGFLAIDRENDRNALRTILTAADYMKRGVCSVGIYPEGTRSRTDELLPFHAGSFKAAQRAKVPLAIACVRGTEDLHRGLLLRPHRVYLDILEVLPPERVCSMHTAELAEYSRNRIQTCLDGKETEAQT